jgi:LacI family transcriptional regulator
MISETFRIAGFNMAGATLKSLATATGFSITTVSRALGGFDDVNPETRQIILQEAQRQGYHPNLYARALQKRQVQAVGLVMPISAPRHTDPFLSEFIAGVGQSVYSSGFDLLLSAHPAGTGEIHVYRRLVAGRRVDGMIVMRTRYEDERIRYLQTSDIPFVVFGRTVDPEDYTFIDIDGIAAQRILTEHLIALGHQRIAYISPPSHLMFTRFRLQGCDDALRSAGLTINPDYLPAAELTERGGYEAARDLLALPQPPTAIMTGNDLMAFGVMRAIQEAGLRVGHDVAVGGFDDVPAAEHIHPGLTTIHQPIFEIGRRLAELLLREIAGQPITERHILLSPELIVRASSDPSRQSQQKGG